MTLTPTPSARGSITAEQFKILGAPLNQRRIAKRSGGGSAKLSYLEAWDVKAHLTRVFGFCNWDSLVSDIRLVSCEQDGNKWVACYQVTVTLRIRDQHGLPLCEFAEAAVGTGQLPQKGEALDMALKTAESDALKRAAIALGTQFGLSLYDNGNTQDIIRHTLVLPAELREAKNTPAPKVEEVGYDQGPAAEVQPEPAPAPAPAPAPKAEPAPAYPLPPYHFQNAEEAREAYRVARDAGAPQDIKDAIIAAGKALPGADPEAAAARIAAKRAAAEAAAAASYPDDGWSNHGGPVEASRAASRPAQHPADDWGLEGEASFSA